MDSTTMEARELFSRRLVAILKKKDLKQVDIARYMGVSESAVGKWVLKKSMPRTMGQIQRLADFLGVPKSYFLDEDFNNNGIPDTHTVPPRRESTLSDGARFAAILRRLQADMNRAFDAAVFAALHGEGYTPTGEWNIDRDRIRQESRQSTTGNNAV